MKILQMSVVSKYIKSVSNTRNRCMEDRPGAVDQKLMVDSNPVFVPIHVLHDCNFPGVTTIFQTMKFVKFAAYCSLTAVIQTNSTNDSMVGQT